MATFSLDQVEIFGKGVLQAEGVVIDKDGLAHGAGRSGIVYKVTPNGAVTELAQLPDGSMPNGVIMNREGNIVYCNLAKQAVMRFFQDGQASLIALASSGSRPSIKAVEPLRSATSAMMVLRSPSVVSRDSIAVC